MTIMPFVIAIIALYVNGTEYFIAGFLMLFVSLVGYIICKWVYGGLYKIDPLKYPINPNTKLAKGDTVHIGAYILISGVAAVIGSILLYLYEGEWGEEYYLEEYGSGLFSNFWGMLDACRIGGIILIIVGIALYYIGKKKDPTH